MEDNLIKLCAFLFKNNKLKETHKIFKMIDQIKENKNDSLDEKSDDHGKNPWVIDIEDLTKNNKYFRNTKWTGDFLQMTVMSLEKDEEIGTEMHKDVDQFIRIEQGKAKVFFGSDKDDLSEQYDAEDDYAIFIPAGTWHNIINAGDETLKMYSIYAEPEHSAGTIHKTYEEAMKYEEEHE